MALRYHPDSLNWHPSRQWRQDQLPQQVRRWLLDGASLTQRLIHAASGDFRVRLLRQQWRRPRHDEAVRLGLAPRERALVREVLLCGHGVPWVYGRSIFPVEAASGPLRHLRLLRNQSLGAELFAAPGVQRSLFELTLAPPDRLALPGAIVGDAPVWGRRSVFTLHQRSLLVSEFFLPAFAPWAAFDPPRGGQSRRSHAADFPAEGGI